MTKTWSLGSLFWVELIIISKTIILTPCYKKMDNIVTVTLILSTIFAYQKRNGQWAALVGKVATFDWVASILFFLPDWQLQKHDDHKNGNRPETAHTGHSTNNRQTNRHLPTDLWSSRVSGHTPVSSQIPNCSSASIEVHCRQAVHMLPHLDSTLTTDINGICHQWQLKQIEKFKIKMLLLLLTV